MDATAIEDVQALPPILRQRSVARGVLNVAMPDALATGYRVHHCVWKCRHKKQPQA
jgi:hypothetical protein